MHVDNLILGHHTDDSEQPSQARDPEGQEQADEGVVGGEVPRRVGAEPDLGLDNLQPVALDCDHAGERRIVGINL